MHKNVHILYNSNGHLALSLNTHAIFQLRIISLTQCPCAEKKVPITETAERWLLKLRTAMLAQSGQ